MGRIVKAGFRALVVFSRNFNPMGSKILFSLQTGFIAGLAPYFPFFGSKDPAVGVGLFQAAPSPEFATLGCGDIGRGRRRDHPRPAVHGRRGAAQVPTVFRIGIKNTTSATKTYALNFTDIPAGFTADSSLPLVTVPAGATAEIGLCLHPTGAIPPPGTPLSFAVAVTDTADPAVTTTATESFTMPRVDALTLSANPATLNTTPGTSASETITITNVGNVAEIERRADVDLADRA